MTLPGLRVASCDGCSVHALSPFCPSSPCHITFLPLPGLSPRCTLSSRWSWGQGTSRECSSFTPVFQAAPAFCLVILTLTVLFLSNVLPTGPVAVPAQGRDSSLCPSLAWPGSPAPSPLTPAFLWRPCGDTSVPPPGDTCSCLPSVLRKGPVTEESYTLARSVRFFFLWSTAQYFLAGSNPWS